MRRTLAALALVLVVGGALRFDAAFDPSPYQSRDEGAYVGIARGLADKRIYGTRGMDDPAHWVPGAPLMFALGYQLFPPASGSSHDEIGVIYVEQAIVGTLTIAAAFLLAFLLAGRRAGLVAAALVAVYPPLIDASGDALSEPLGALLATSALAATVWAMRTGGPWRAGLAGLLVAATVLTRADLALLPAIAFLMLGVAVWRRAPGRKLPALTRGLAPLAVGALVLLVPWSAYASDLKGSFVPLSSGGESNLFMGTYLPGEGTLFGAKRALAAETQRRDPRQRGKRYFQIAQRDIIITVAERRPELPEAEALSAAGRENLREYALGRPVAFTGMMLDKAWRLWGSIPVGTRQGSGSNAPPAWQRALHLVILALAVAGLAAGLALGRRRRLELGLVLLAVLYITAVNMVLVSEARHNMTLMPAVMAAGPAGLVLGLGAVRRRRAADRGAAEPEAGAPPSRPVPSPA